MRTNDAAEPDAPNDPLSRLVRIFLDSQLSAMLIVFSLIVGLAALIVSPREEDPQIVVPLADVYVRFPGHSANEVEQLAAGPLERMLYQIDGVEYVYSMARENEAIITVRFYVGEDRERSLVKLFKKLDENVDAIPPGIAGWVVKPVEIDDVPLVTLTLTGADSHALRRLGEEAIERLAAIPNVSRAYVLGGEPRVVRVELDADRLRGAGLSPTDVAGALAGANVVAPVGRFARADEAFTIEARSGTLQPESLGELVVGVADGRPVFLRDVAQIVDGPAEVVSYVRHGWGPARDVPLHHGGAGTVFGAAARAAQRRPPRLDAGDLAHHVANASQASHRVDASQPAVTLALAKKKGSNAVRVAAEILSAAETLQRDVLPDDVEMVVTRNYGATADEKVNELIEALGVAVLIVVALLTLSLGWREAIIVAVAVPVVFGLTLAP